VTGLNNEKQASADALNAELVCFWRFWSENLSTTLPSAPRLLPSQTMPVSFHKSLQFLLFFMLGLSSWFVVSAVFSEIPLLAQLLMEADAVGSTLDLCVNLSNIVPLLLVLFQRKTGKLSDAPIIFMSCTTNIIVCFAMIFMFPSPSNRSSSLSLIIVTSLAGIVGNTSMVTLFPYVRPFGPAAITALSSGIGACGLVAQLLTTAQSVGRTRIAADGTSQPDPSFSLQVFFSCVCACSMLSLICFVIIHKRMIYLRGEGWMHGSVGVEQPAAGVAHLLRADDDEGRDFSEASETYKTSSAATNAHSGGEAGAPSIREDDSSGGNSRGNDSNSRSINPAVLFHSLTVSERWVCATLACSCFVMYVLPGELVCNTCSQHCLTPSLYEQVSYRSCVVPLKTDSQSCNGHISYIFSDLFSAVQPYPSANSTDSAPSPSSAASRGFCS
jgi:hypothetical protein